MPNKYIPPLVIALLLISLVVLASDVRQVKSKENGVWWNSAWRFRRLVQISERNGYNLTDFPIEVTLRHDGYAQPNGTDIRVLDNSIEIPSCVEEYNSTHAKIAFEINMTALESKIIYFYYGNPTATAPDYPLVSLTITEGNTGHVVIDDSVYLGWDYTSWGWSNNVVLWNAFRIDFNKNRNPLDNDDLIRDDGSRQGGIGRFRGDLQAVGLGDYMNYSQTPIYADINFAYATLRVYINHVWVETTQADYCHIFSSSYDYLCYGGGIEDNIVDGLGINNPPGQGMRYTFSESPAWMAFRDSASGYVFASTGSNISSEYAYEIGGKEASQWDRNLNYNNRTRYEPTFPYDQPSGCRIYWYGDNSNNYSKIEKTATILNNQPKITVVPDTITVPDDFSRIQEAINHANEGDTVFVRNGTYYEHVMLNRTLQLIGENRYSTIIEGEYKDPPGFFGSIVYVAANNVKISGFTIQHCRGGGNAICLNGYVNMTFSNNIITGNNEGIRILYSYGNVISYNIVQDCYYNTGVGFDWSYNNVVHCNTIIHNHYGLSGGYDNHNNTYSGNTIINNDIGFGTNMYDDKFFHNNFVNNGVDVIANDANAWNNTCEGNYWSDYNGTDSNFDGIGDTPYVIDANNIDHCPLMNPYWVPADINHDLKVGILDVVKITGCYGCAPSDPDYNPHADIAAPYGKIDILDVVLCTRHYGEKYR